MHTRCKFIAHDIAYYSCIDYEHSPTVESGFKQRLTAIQSHAGPQEVRLQMTTTLERRISSSVLGSHTKSWFETSNSYFGTAQLLSFGRSLQVPQRYALICRRAISLAARPSKRWLPEMRTADRIPRQTAPTEAHANKVRKAKNIAHYLQW